MTGAAMRQEALIPLVAVVPILEPARPKHTEVPEREQAEDR